MRVCDHFKFQPEEAKHSPRLRVPMAVSRHFTHLLDESEEEELCVHDARDVDVADGDGDAAIAPLRQLHLGARHLLYVVHVLVLQRNKTHRVQSHAVKFFTLSHINFEQGRASPKTLCCCPGAGRGRR